MMCINLSVIEIRSEDSHGTSHIPPHLTFLEEDLKQQLVCHDSLKDFLSILGLEKELSIPFAQNRFADS